MSKDWTLSREGRAELRALLAKATPDPFVLWRARQVPRYADEPLSWDVQAPHVSGASACPWSAEGLCSEEDANLIAAAVNALPGLLDQVDELERGYQCHFESQRALFDEVATLKAELAEWQATGPNALTVIRLADERIAALEAERDELRFRLTKQQEAREAVEAERDALRHEVERLRGANQSLLSKPPMKRVAVLEAERDELRFRLTKQQEAREAVEAERDALREENERLRDTCDIRGSNWERAEAQLSAAREALAALAPPEATEGEGK